MKGIEHRLRAVRDSLSLTQGEMASRLGVPYRTYQNYEQGKTAPKVASLVALSASSGISLDWLILGRGEQAGCASPQPPALDLKVLAGAESLIDGWLRAAGRRMEPEARAAAVADAYALIAAMVEKGMDRADAVTVACDNVVRLKFA